MKLNSSNYFSNEASQEYFSVSQYKSFCKCEACALAEIRGETKTEPSNAMLVSSYVDAYFSNELETFKAENPRIFTNKGTLRSEFSKAEQIIKRIESDKFFSECLAGSSQTIMTGELFGYKWKIKVDSLHDDKIVDLKCMRDFEDIYVDGQGRLPWYVAWGYDVQGAVYQEIVRQNTGKKLPFIIAAATKEAVTDIDVIHLPDAMLEDALKIVEARIDRFAEIKEGLTVPVRCEKCNYCKETKVIRGFKEVD